MAFPSLLRFFIVISMALGQNELEFTTKVPPGKLTCFHCVNYDPLYNDCKPSPTNVKYATTGCYHCGQGCFNKKEDPGSKYYEGYICVNETREYKDCTTSHKANPISVEFRGMMWATFNYCACFTELCNTEDNNSPGTSTTKVTDDPEKSKTSMSTESNTSTDTAATTEKGGKNDDTTKAGGEGPSNPSSVTPLNFTGWVFAALFISHSIDVRTF